MVTTGAKEDAKALDHTDGSYRLKMPEPSICHPQVIPVPYKGVAKGDASSGEVTFTTRALLKASFTGPAPPVLYHRAKPQETPLMPSQRPKLSSTDMDASATARPIPVEDRIRTRAYQIYLQRDGRNGFAERDWFEAEREILSVV